MPSLAAYTIYAFGLTAFVMGVWHLVSPDTAVQALGLPAECKPAANGEHALPFILSLSPSYKTRLSKLFLPLLLCYSIKTHFFSFVVEFVLGGNELGAEMT